MQDYQAPAGLLKNKIILVTGASDGIGKAASISFAQLGATVILLGRSQEKLIYVYDTIEKSGFPKPAILPLDLAHVNGEQLEQLAQKIQDEFGRLDGVLHNAAVLGEVTSLENYEYGTWDQVMATNVRGVFLLTQALLPLLRQAPQASVVLTSSSVGRMGRAYWGAYAVSKAAIESLNQIWSQELKNTSHIRFNCINPGAVRTAMRMQAYPAENPENLRRPEEILNLYHYLMGDASVGISGQSLDAQPNN